MQHVGHADTLCRVHALQQQRNLYSIAIGERAHSRCTYIQLHQECINVCTPGCMKVHNIIPAKPIYFSSPMLYMVTSLLCTFLKHHGHCTGMNRHSLSKCSSHWLCSSCLGQPYCLLGHGIFLNLQEAMCSYLLN